MAESKHLKMASVYKFKRKSFKIVFISYLVIIISTEEMMDRLTARRFALKIHRTVVMPTILIHYRKYFTVNHRSKQESKTRRVQNSLLKF